MDYQTLAIGGLIIAAVIFNNFMRRKATVAVEQGETEASAQLGLTPVTPELTPDPRWQEVAQRVGSGKVVAFGQMEGRSAHLGTFSNSAGHELRRRNRNSMTQAKVYLTFTLTRPAPMNLRIQQRVPMLLQKKRPKEPPAVTGDREFDERFEVFCIDQNWALKVLDVPTRQLLLAARRGVAGGKEDATGWAGAHTALFFGEFKVVQDVVVYRWDRRLNDESIKRFKEFAPLLAQLANRVEAAS